MKLLFMLLMLLSPLAHAEMVGIIAHDIQKRSDYLTAELMNKFSIDEGLSIQARVTHFSGKRFNLDGGYGFHSGDREHRLFLGGAFEIFPDHNQQPRIQIKAHTEIVGEFDDFDFLAGITPIASKGISVGNQIMYPFVAMPIRRVFRKGAESEISLNLGSTFELKQNLILSAELTFNLRNTPSAILVGISTNL